VRFLCGVTSTPQSRIAWYQLAWHGISTPQQKSHHNSLMTPFATQSQSTIGYAEMHFPPIIRFAITQELRPSWAKFAELRASGLPTGLPTGPLRRGFGLLSRGKEEKKEERRSYRRTDME
jgi:hypothetical protein